MTRHIHRAGFKNRLQGIMTTIASNLQAVRSAISSAALKAGRSPSEVKLLAVSKTFAAAAINDAYMAGQQCFAENYLQEALAKITALQQLEIEWHFIGPIQSNKTRTNAENFSWVHSVDRLKVAERLSAQRPRNLPPLQICLQINISDEESKSGVGMGDVGELAKNIAELPNLTLRGLMAIPAPSNDLNEQRLSFAKLRNLRDDLNRQGTQMDTLSMGMSHDFEAAILEGSTIVRIGTAIFGDRTYPKETT